MAVLDQRTIGDVLFMVVDADPNGNVTAPKASVAVDKTNAKFYMNTDGATAWTEKT
jgi:hypothetical protein